MQSITAYLKDAEENFGRVYQEGNGPGGWVYSWKERQLNGWITGVRHQYRHSACSSRAWAIAGEAAAQIIYDRCGDSSEELSEYGLDSIRDYYPMHRDEGLTPVQRVKLLLKVYEGSK